MRSYRSTDPRCGWVLVAGGMLSIGLQSAVFFATALLLAAIPDDTGWSGAATAAGFAYVATGTDLTSFAAAAMMALISLGCMWVLG